MDIFGHTYVRDFILQYFITSQKNFESISGERKQKMVMEWQNRLWMVSWLWCLVTINSLGMPAPKRLKQLLQSEMDGTRKSDVPILLPCCYDGLTARLIAQAGFEATFMTGFGVSGTC